MRQQLPGRTKGNATNRDRIQRQSRRQASPEHRPARRRRALHRAQGGRQELVWKEGVFSYLLSFILSPILPPLASFFLSLLLLPTASDRPSNQTRKQASRNKTHSTILTKQNSGQRRHHHRQNHPSHPRNPLPGARATGLGGQHGRAVGRLPHKRWILDLSFCCLLLSPLEQGPESEDRLWLEKGKIDA